MGAAGDMLTAALLELLPDREAFLKELNGLGIPGVVYSSETVTRCGIRGTLVTVKVNGQEESENLSAHEEKKHHHHSSLHRIEEIVGGLPVPEKVRRNILAVYSLIAEAESHVHGVPVSEIHFHEVGTMDAVADVTAVCLLLDRLAPEQVVVSPVRVGSGQVKCAHGILPVPAPATAYLLREVPIFAGDIREEMCTPTGAALLKHFAAKFSPLPLMRVAAIGYGMGTKEYGAAGCVRALFGETEEAKAMAAGGASAVEKAWAAFDQRTRGFEIKNALLFREGRELLAIHRDEDCLRNGYSATKSFTAALFAAAAQKGMVSPDERIVDCFPEELPEEVSPELSRLTFRHLLSMTVGQEKPWLMGASRPVMKTPDWVRFSLAQKFVHEPGTVFQYTNVGPYLAGIHVARRSGRNLASLLYESLWKPMGYWFPTWEVDPLGNNFGAGGLMVTTKQLLSFGVLLLHGGEDQGKQLLPAKFVEAVSHPVSFPVKRPEGADGYTYGFWLGPEGSFRADGKYGQYAIVFPEQQAVFAMTADCQDPAKVLKAFYEMVLPEV